MADPRIHTPQRLAPGIRIEVEGQAATHVVQVLRLRAGASLRVFDGRGHEFGATLLDNRRTRLHLELHDELPGTAESTLDILLAQGIARHDRMDLILQKAVELGVNTIQPLWLQRSQSHLGGERLEKRLLHWQGVIISACEQCGRNTLPELRHPLSLPDWLAGDASAGLRLLLQPGSARILPGLAGPAGRIELLVGPEGGLSPDEQALALDCGFTGIRLGPRILRTETAALAAIAGMHMLWGDFSTRGDRAAE